MRFTPSGNVLTIEMAKAAIEGEDLGHSANTDFLTISFSSTDYVGHAFGPNSIEAEDTYLRLDNTLADFINYLDKRVGKGQYTLFLTADHGVAHVPGFDDEDAHIPAGAAKEADMQTALNEAIDKRFGIRKAVEDISNYQVYFSEKINDTLLTAVKETAIRRLMELPYIANAIDLQHVSDATLPAVQKTMMTNGYNQKLSGDIQFIYKPQWIAGSSKGTTHGSWNPYDAHIPLLWYGWGINKGSTHRETFMTDIAATTAALLHIQMPSGCVGKVIEGVLK